MGKKTYSTEQIIVKLRRIKIQRSQGKTIKEAAREAEMTEQARYRWRKQYGGMNTSEAKRLKNWKRERSLEKAGSGFVAG